MTGLGLPWAGDESEEEHIIHYLKELRDVIRNFITSLRLYSGKIIDFAFMSFKTMNYVITPDLSPAHDNPRLVIFSWYFSGRVLPPHTSPTVLAKLRVAGDPQAASPAHDKQ